MVTWYLVFLAVLALERVIEMVISRRHAAWALARGGIELGQRHFLFMKVLHVGFFCACAAEVVWWHRPFTVALAVPMGLLVLLSQGLRYWAVATLGRRWNIRVIVIPGECAVNSGPYRYLRHPNYVAVMVEGVAVPLVHGAWFTAIAFTLLNAIVLGVRIRCEERALTQYSKYQERLGSRRRFLPTWPVGTAAHER